MKKRQGMVFYRRPVLWVMILLSVISFTGRVTAADRASGGAAASAGIAGGTPDLDWHGTEYATQFSLEYQTDDCIRITIGEDSFLLVPEGVEEPEDPGFPVLRQPLDNIYAASSSALDLFLQAGALDQVAMTSTSADNWTIPEIRDAVSSDEILYVGKYSAPDFEVILDGGCSLAIENTMIYHCPQIKEQLQRLGIPVLVERSSYETHPLGRVEWIRLYGLLTGKTEEAEAFFRESADRLKAVEDAVERTGGTDPSGIREEAPAEGGDTDDHAGEEKKVVFFYITSSGYANVRKAGDYISRMIELAGGRYLFSDLTDDTGNALSTINMDLETFYAAAKDADILIYNSTVTGELKTLADLLEKSPLLADFKAVRSGNAWCTGQNMFQQVSATAEMIEDFHTVITGEEKDTKYVRRLE